MRIGRAPGASGGGAASSGGVHVGRDGWLFLTGGTNGALAQYRPSLARSLRFARWRALVRARARRAAALGIAYAQIVVPEKLSVHDAFTDGLAYDPAEAPARRIGEGLEGAGWVDLVGSMRAAARTTPLYLRTDTHWNFAGCELAYRRLCGALGIAPVGDFAERAHRESDETLDLARKLDPSPRERARFYDFTRDSARVYANPLLLAHEAAGRAIDLHVGAHVVYRNAAPGADPRRVVLFGDSCAHFSTFMLTGMLAETVAELHFVWSPRFDWSYVRRVRPDVLIGETAERFTRRVPRDRFDLEADGAARLTAFRAAQEAREAALRLSAAPARH